MKRRTFLFNSLKAALLLSPVIAGRRALAEPTRPKRVLFWVNSGGYPDPEAFFPTGGENNFELSPILSNFGDLSNDMVVIDGLDIRNSGPNPKNNNHVRTPGKILTAKDVLTVDDPLNGDPGGPSIDQKIANDLGLNTIEQLVHTKANNHMRAKPFATGPRAFKTPIVRPELVWDKVFKGFEAQNDPAAEQARINRLLARQSVLDDLTSELRRFRGELTGEERLKLDIHEDAISRAEQSVLDDLASGPLPDQCVVPDREVPGNAIPVRGKAHFDLLYASFMCDRVQVAGMMWGYSGYHWRYQWVQNVDTDDIHDSVHHRATQERQAYINSCRWDWDQLGDFVRRLKQTPEDGGTMLDHTLVVATSHFGRHHQMTRIPMVLFGNAAGQLSTGRYLKVSGNHDRLLTSVANLMGDPLSGFGDDANCGPLAAL